MPNPACDDLVVCMERVSYAQSFLSQPSSPVGSATFSRGGVKGLPVPRAKCHGSAGRLIALCAALLGAFPHKGCSAGPACRGWWRSVRRDTRTYEVFPWEFLNFNENIL